MRPPDPTPVINTASPYLRTHLSVCTAECTTFTKDVPIYHALNLLIRPPILSTSTPRNAITHPHNSPQKALQPHRRNLQIPHPSSPFISNQSDQCSADCAPSTPERCRSVVQTCLLQCQGHGTGSPDGNGAVHRSGWRGEGLFLSVWISDLDYGLGCCVVLLRWGGCSHLFRCA